MLQKDFCTSPTLNDHDFSHYHHRRIRDQSPDSTVPAESRSVHRPQLLDLERRSRTPGLLGAGPGRGRGILYRGIFTERDAHDVVQDASDSAFSSIGMAGSQLLDPYYLGDTVSHIAPTQFSFGGTRRDTRTPKANKVVQKSSSTISFSEFSDEDFQISYQKVLESPAPSWLQGDDDDDDEELSCRQARNRIPSVELPSLIRPTHKSRSEQLTRTSIDVPVMRPRSEDLTRYKRRSPPSYKELETSFLQATLLGCPKDTTSSSKHCSFRSSLKSEEELASPQEWYPPRHSRQKHPTGGYVRVPTTTQLEGQRIKPPRISNMTSAPPPAAPPTGPVSPTGSLEKGSEKSQPGSLHEQIVAGRDVSLDVASTSRSMAQQGCCSPSSGVKNNGLKRPRSQRIDPSPSRSLIIDAATSSAFVQADKPTAAENCDVEMAKADVSTQSADNSLDKAVQVHIPKSDRMLIACCILSGALFVALLAVILFVVLDRYWYI